MSSSRKSLYLIDGHAQIYRCYYAPFRDLTAPSGEPTKATYVFCNMLLKLAGQRRPDHLAMVMDVPTETLLRRQAFAEYKAQRQPPPEDMEPQIQRILAILSALKIPILRAERFEADDVMATIVRRVRDQAEQTEVFLVSRDKDLEQLLDSGVFMYDPARDELIDADALEASKGYRPAQAIDLQTLTGDSTDNIPGVPGVGVKTAVRLIGKYGSAEAVVAHADEQSPKLRANLKAFAESLPLTRDLVSLRTDVPVDVDLDAWRFDGIDTDALRPIFRELGFDRLLQQLDRMDGSAPAAAVGPVDPIAAQPGALETASGADYRSVETDEQLGELAAKLRGSGGFAFDTETTGLRPIDAELVGLSFSWAARQGYYVPVRSVTGPTVAIESVRRELGAVLADGSIPKCGQNVKYDLIVLRQAGIEVAGADFDSMIAAFLLAPTRRSYGLSALAEDLLGYRMIEITELIGKGKKQIPIDQVDPELLCTYAAEDADIAMRLRRLLEPRLSEAGLEELFRATEMPLVAVLAEMEHAGVAIDTDHLAKLSNSLADRIKSLKRQIHNEAGHEFNIDSPRQLGQVLFDELGLRVVRKTKTSRSTDAETLSMLAWETDEALPKLVLQYRELTKLKNTYVDTLPEMISEKTGRIHASFNPTGAVTGRLSSSEPNLQNIPVRTEQGREIRRAFVPGLRGHVLLTADYSQVELRVLAHFCQDEGLLAAFREDRDIHTYVASQIFGVPLEQVDGSQRGRAKAVNFGIIYGQTPYGLSRGVGIPVGEAKAFIDMYFLRYPGIRMFLDDCIGRARRNGYVETILGRRRPVEEIHSRNATRRSLGERLAVNTVIQGSAADLIKKAMLSIHRHIRRDRLPARMLIQVHDELVFEVPAEAAAETAEMVRHEMTTALDLDVPLKVDIHTGANWLESK